MKNINLFLISFLIVAIAAIGTVSAVVSVTSDPEYGVAPLSVTFTAAGGDGTYNWDFKDGSTGTGAVVTHKFQQPGYYLVEVSSNGETATYEIGVVPNTPASNNEVQITKNPGWRTFSTPLPLVDPYLPNVLANNAGDIQVALVWQNNQWVQGNTNIAPLDGAYLYILNQTTITLHPNFKYGDVATRNIPNQFSLVGYVPLYDGHQGAARTNFDLINLDGLVYKFIASINNQNNEWAYYKDSDKTVGNVQFNTGEAYWLFTSNPGVVTFEYM